MIDLTSTHTSIKIIMKDVDTGEENGLGIDNHVVHDFFESGQWVVESMVQRYLKYKTNHREGSLILKWYWLDNTKPFRVDAY